jgi:hypothetical protein
MAAANNQITAPRVDFLDKDGRISREWYMFLYNLYALVGTGTGIIPVTSGGTGVITIPTDGQLLIGNGTGYTLNTLGTGSGISVANGAGTITVANTGVLSNIAGTGISVSGATGNVTIANTGVLSAIAGSGISVSSATGNITFANTGVLSFSGGTTGLTPVAAAVGVVVLGGTLIAANGGTGFASYAVGDLLYADTTTTLAKLADVATGNALISGGVSTAPSWGKIGLTTHVDGVLPIANGGTNATATPIAGAVAYGTGTAYAFTAAGSAGQVLTSAGAGVPIWTTNAGGDVTGPASSTDNAVARFDSTTGKLIQNSTVIIDDTGATTGVTTLAASTSVTTPIVQASNSAGLSLKNASGTIQMSVGAGGGDNMSINVSTNLNGTNAQIDISPTGTGHVHIKPGGTGSVEVAPTNVGTIDNMTIGATTPKNASVVDLSVTGTLSFDAAQGTAGQVLTSAGTGATPTWTTPTTGTVTSVTGTAPVASSGGTTPVISMAAANTSTNGYLTSTDWNTFNSKQPAGTYVTSVAVASSNGFAGTSSGGATPTLTLTTSISGIIYGNGTALAAATISAPLGYSAGTLSITQAGAASNGYLSSTDWNTFNNKQPAGTYVTAVSVVSANGLAGTSSGGATPALTLSTSITGILKGNGTAISAATSGTDYAPATSGTSILYGNGSGGFSNVTVGSGLSFSAGTLAATTSAPSAPVTKTADFTVAATDVWLINNKSGSTCTVTLPTASTNSGRVLYFQNYQTQTLVSASSNVVPLAGGSAATSILLASSGDSATLVSDGTNWLMTQYVPNNILLLG